MRPAPLLPLLGCLLLAGCFGPEASDAALCQDTAHRLCLASDCASLSSRLSVDPRGGCQESLLERSGCGAEGFVFTAPSRERVLECRRELLQRGAEVELSPTCEEAERFLRCGDVEAFFKGVRP